jgi:hypothetical protein
MVVLKAHQKVRLKAYQKGELSDRLKAHQKGKLSD